MDHQISLFDMVLRKEFGNTAAACKALSGVPVKLFALQSGRAAQISCATVSKAGAASETEVAWNMHNYYLPCEQGTGLFVIHTAGIADSFKDFAYPYPFHTNGEVLATFGDSFSRWLYAWDCQSLLPVLTASGSN